MTKERRSTKHYTEQCCIPISNALHYISVHIKQMYMVVDRNFINSTLYQIV